jgi:hypothetical protein
LKLRKVLLILWNELTQVTESQPLKRVIYFVAAKHHGIDRIGQCREKRSAFLCTLRSRDAPRAYIRPLANNAVNAATFNLK